MLWITSAILFGLWVLGVLSGGAGAWVHLLLAFAAVSFVLAVAIALPRQPVVRGQHSPE